MSVLILIFIIALLVLIVCIYQTIKIRKDMQRIDREAAEARYALKEMDDCDWTSDCIEKIQNKYKHNSILQEAYKECGLCKK